MYGQFWRLRNEYTFNAFVAFLRSLLDEHGDVVLRWQIGVRTLKQNALFHTWCREWIAHRLKKPPEEVTKTEHESMKWTVKKIFYQNTAAEWILWERIDYSTPEREKYFEFTSSADWSPAEMFQVLTFIQSAAMDDGLILESVGKFKEMQQEQCGV